MKHKSNEKTIKVGGIAMVKGEDKQGSTWKIGRIIEMLVGKDGGIIKGVRFKTTNGFLERPVQLLHLLELPCKNITDDSNETESGMTKESDTNKTLSPEVSTFRPKRTAAAVASIKLKDMTGLNDI